MSQKCQKKKTALAEGGMCGGAGGQLGEVDDRGDLLFIQLQTESEPLEEEEEHTSTVPFLWCIRCIYISPKNCSYV